VKNRKPSDALAQASNDVI